MGIHIDGAVSRLLIKSVLNPTLQPGDKTNKILTHLTDSHNKYILLLESVNKFCQDEQDVATADMLTKFLQDHQQMRWFIMAHNQ